MENAAIIDAISLFASLLEIHGENDFKVKSYHNALFHLEKIDQNLSEMTLPAIQQLQGVGKAIAEKIHQMAQNNAFPQLDALVEKTPQGIIDMLEIKGLGAKKIRTIWQELHIENTDQLQQACQNNQIAQLKGFGEKTQENIKKALLFKIENAEKLHFAKALTITQTLIQAIQKQIDIPIAPIKQMARQYEVIDSIAILCATEKTELLFQYLDQYPQIEKNNTQSGLYAWRGKWKNNPIHLEILTCKPDNFVYEQWLWSAHPQHLQQKNILQSLKNKTQKWQSDQEIYQTLELPYIIAPMREGHHEWQWAEKYNHQQIITLADIKGILHAHSTYSDGKNSLQQMAEACKQKGYQYLGITDHSKTAFYANGLPPYKVEQQHKEIDQINTQLKDFVLFKGIESDILADGSLDYDPEILHTFDFIIASVHANLNMTQEKATQRLIKAIENPHTTLLGHPTGRLLLNREGYPIDHQKVIDACYQNQVAIEINANPWRLDIDWRWVYKAMEKGVLISINPDAHSIAGIDDTQYGIYVAQKAGLIKEATLNALEATEIKKFFDRKK
ncbi:MAG: DNA polymerase/3'-5' exonuclease PolX [Cytophagales bacterium]|nr:MAG: DNA polymerase/3'-5' exonuclease PolX [Cytophagales bacterium]